MIAEAHGGAKLLPKIPKRYGINVYAAFCHRAEQDRMILKALWVLEWGIVSISKSSDACHRLRLGYQISWV